MAETTPRTRLLELLSQANSTTGRADPTIAAAINTLRDGYGQGGPTYNLQEQKTVRYAENGTYIASPDAGYDAVKRVSVEVDVPAPAPKLQNKSVSPTEARQEINADASYDGLDSVTVEAIPSGYIGSGVARQDASGNTILNATTKNKSFPAGYYESAHGAQHSTVDIPNPTITVNASGLITASGSWTAGFTEDTSYSGTKQLATKAGTTITPTKSSQTAISSGTYATGDIKINAIPSEYIVPTGSETKTQNGTYDVTNLAQLIVNVSGGGGVPAGYSAIDLGEIKISTQFTTSRQTFNHKLGVVPDVVIVMANGNVAQTYSMLIAIGGSKVNYRGGNYLNHLAYHGNSSTTVTWTNANSTSYGVSNFTATTFQLASSSSSYYWRAGTYKYIALKFS